MKKLVALVALLTVGIAAVAFAQSSQTNTYEVAGTAKPAKSASKKKPIPVAINVSWDVNEQNGLRPAVVETYSVGFYGGVTNGKFFPKCTAEEINNAQSDAGCPKGSQIGTTQINAVVGSASELGDRSIKCDTEGRIYNSGQGRGAIFIEGRPPQCAVSLATAIDARFVKVFGGKGTAMQFTVPETLRHAVAGTDLAVLKVVASLPKKTTKVQGTTRGFFEIQQKCPKNGKAPVQFVFTQEDGKTSTEDITQPCKG